MKEIAIVTLVVVIGLFSTLVKPALVSSFVQIEEQAYRDREAAEIEKAKATLAWVAARGE
jgi:hypothetical protein